MINSTVALIIASLLSSYIIGSIPFSFIIAKSNGVDIFNVGSGNPGASNVLRSVGKKFGILAYICDIGKGMIAITISYNIMKHSPYMSLILVICSAMAVIGHMCSIFLKFRGGKGVAVGSGVMFMLSPIPLLTALIFFFIGLILSKKIIAVGSTVGSIALPIFLTIYHFFIPSLYKYFFNIDYKYLMPMTVILMIFIIIKHIPNYKRMIKGKENSFEKK